MITDIKKQFSNICHVEIFDHRKRCLTAQDINREKEQEREMILRLQRLRQIRSYTIVRKNMRGEKLRQSEEEEREEELDFESESDWEQDYPEKVFKKIAEYEI